MASTSKKQRLDSDDCSLKSVSTMAKDKKADEILPEKPLYYHWLALKIYNTHLKVMTFFTSDGLYTDACRSLGKITCDGISVNISDLEKCSDFIKMASSFSCLAKNEVGRGVMSNSEIRTSELAFSAFYSRALDRFLFPDERIGACLHQGPNRERPGGQGSPESSDLYIVPFRLSTAPKGTVAGDHECEPGAPIGEADVKLQDFGKAIRESALYNLSSMDTTFGQKHYPVLLSFPATVVNTQLEAHVIRDNSLWRIILCNSRPWNPSFLATLYIAVHYVIQAEIVWPLTSPSRPCLQKSSNLGSTYFNDRVYVNGGRVHKLYDTKFNADHPNIDIVKSIGGLENPVLVELTTDGRVLDLSYDYIEGDHKPTSLRQFTKVVQTLHKLHAINYVHGDVRKENVVFNTEGHLIDFDLACPAGNKYPKGYNYFFPERHVEAIELSKMELVHDRYSLQYLMRQVHVEGKNVKAKEQVCADLLNMQKSLQDIAGELETCSF